MIYISTDIHGRGVKHITAFDNRLDLWAYADDVLACHNTNLCRSDSIDTLCDKLYDNGIGRNARSHRRVSRQDAKDYIKQGATANGCWKL